MCVIGIDPGLSGAICVLSTEGRGILDIIKMPLCERPHRKGNYIDIEKVYDFITHYSIYNEYTHIENLHGIYIERQFILRSQGMSSGSKTMYQSGILYGVCYPECDNLQEINAKDWQGPIFKKVDESLIKEYNYSNKTKLKSIAFVEQTYGANYLFTSKRQTKPHDGLADAICIAHFGMEEIKKIKSTNKYEN